MIAGTGEPPCRRETKDPDTHYDDWGGMVKLVDIWANGNVYTSGMLPDDLVTDFL